MRRSRFPGWSRVTAALPKVAPCRATHIVLGDSEKKKIPAPEKVRATLTGEDGGWKTEGRTVTLPALGMAIFPSLSLVHFLPTPRVEMNQRGEAGGIKLIYF